MSSRPASSGNGGAAEQPSADRQPSKAQRNPKATRAQDECTPLRKEFNNCVIEHRGKDVKKQCAPITVLYKQCLDKLYEQKKREREQKGM